MDGEEHVFLSMEEAISAVRIDFDQYPPQTDLFMDLYPLVLGPKTLVLNDPRNGLWFAPPDPSNRNSGRKTGQKTRRMRTITPRELGQRILGALAAFPPSAPVMADICKRTFLVHAEPANGASGTKSGIALYPDTEGFQCRQCGNCCRVLDYRYELTADDYEVWKKLARDDIMERVATITRNGRANSYAIWIEPGTRQLAKTCPWLLPRPSPNGKNSKSTCFICGIHDVKPDICRQYPGTRKHARMTGCAGYEETEFKSP